jgi:hypothetical protein
MLHSARQPCQQRVLTGCGCDEVCNVDATRLPDAVDAAGALLEP